MRLASIYYKHNCQEKEQKIDCFYKNRIVVLKIGITGNIFGWLEQIICIYFISYVKIRFKITNFCLKNSPQNELNSYDEFPLYIITSVIQ